MWCKDLSPVSKCVRLRHLEWLGCSKVGAVKQLHRPCCQARQPSMAPVISNASTLLKD